MIITLDRSPQNDIPYHNRNFLISPFDLFAVPSVWGWEIFCAPQQRTGQTNMKDIFNESSPKSPTWVLCFSIVRFAHTVIGRFSSAFFPSFAFLVCRRGRDAMKNVQNIRYIYAYIAEVGPDSMGMIYSDHRGGNISFGWLVDRQSILGPSLRQTNGQNNVSIETPNRTDALSPDGAIRAACTLCAMHDSAIAEHHQWFSAGQSSVSD